MADTPKRRSRLQLTDAFKAGVVRLVLDDGKTVGAVARDRVSPRTREMGVRMALGAGQSTIFREVVLQGLVFAVVDVD